MLFYGPGKPLSRGLLVTFEIAFRHGHMCRVYGSYGTLKIIIIIIV
jgi:hypothetical protein